MHRICLLYFSEEDPRKVVKSINIGYWLREKHTGKGYATEAVKTLSEFALNKNLCEAVSIGVNAKNIKSAAVAQRCGFSKLRETKIWEHSRPDWVEMQNYVLYVKYAEEGRF